MKQYIIDGNNLIGKIKHFFSIQKKDPQAAREKLAFAVERYFKDKKAEIFIHFDGYQNLPIKIKSKIIYSESSTADDMIKNQISSIKNRKNIVLISSDKNVMDFAKVCSCEVISCEKFAKNLMDKKNNNDEEERIKSINNIEEFKKIFNVK